MGELLETSPVRLQAGVLAYRETTFGTEILLVTRRSSSGWTIPKGCRDAGRTALDTARSEALEEGGVDGRPHLVAMGRFDYRKLGVTCRLEVFAMKVENVYPTWADDKVRVRGWFPIDSARRLLEGQELAAMLRALERMVAD